MYLNHAFNYKTEISRFHSILSSNQEAFREKTAQHGIYWFLNQDMWHKSAPFFKSNLPSEQDST